MDSLTQFVLEYMDRSGVDKAVVFGNSMGGQIALNVALVAPHRVAGLVLTGSAGLLERSMSNNAPLNPDRPYIRERVKEVFHNEVWVTDGLVDEVYQTLQGNRNKLRLVKLARSLRQVNMHDLLPRIAVPTLLVWGREDTITPVEVGKTFAQRLPTARLHVFDRCGHAPNIEAAERFNRVAEQFLNEIGYV